MKKRRIVLILLSVLLLSSMALSFTSCSTDLKIHADDLMKGVSAGKVEGKAIDEAFIRSQTELALRLFKASVRDSENKNVLISPLSIQLALAMTANGADGETLAEMETLLGGDIPTETLNEYLYSLIKNLMSNEKVKLHIANSIWFRDIEQLYVNEEFLQTNADYYGASAYKAPFNDRTVKDINNWIKKNTDGMIDKMIDDIDPSTVMLIINALLFDAEWENIYQKNDVKRGIFTSLSGENRTVEMMSSTECKYISDENAVGFIKNYAGGGKYGFAVLLPHEGVDLYDYIDSLSAQDLQSIFSSVKYVSVDAKMPKFSYDYDILLNDVLQGLGMKRAFSPYADFSKLGHSERGNIFISRVLHKTSITVAEKGTRAGAATMVDMKDYVYMPSEEYRVTLDRPFVYMIIDNENNTPIFIGAVTDIGN